MGSKRMRYRLQLLMVLSLVLSLLVPVVQANTSIFAANQLPEYAVDASRKVVNSYNNQVNLTISEQAGGGELVPHPDYYKAVYETDDPDVTIDQETGVLTYNGAFDQAKQIEVKATVQEYENLVHSESFENGWGEYAREEEPAANPGSGPILSDKVAYHGNAGVQYNETPAVEKRFGSQQQGIVTMMFYDSGSKAGNALRAVAHVGNKRNDMFAGMGVFFDGGSVGQKDNYSVRASNSFTAWIDTGIPRAKGWHEFKWDYSTGTDLKMYIDGQLVHSTTSIKSFDRINLSFVWDKADGRVFGFDNIKYAANSTILTKQAVPLKITVEPEGEIVHRTFYISSIDGNDSNDGMSENTPWKSLNRVMQAAGEMRPGDKYLFKAGDAWTGSLKLNNIAGTVDAPIVFDKYGSDHSEVRPIINGNGTTSTEPLSLYTYYSSIRDKTQSAVIDMTDVSHIEINNFELTNYSQTVVSQRSGIAIKMTATNQTEWEANPQYGITIRNNYVHDVNGNPNGHKMGSGGILLFGNINDVLVENNKVVNVDIEGIRNAGLYREGDTDANFPRVLRNVQFNNNYVQGTQGDGMVMSNVGELGRMEYNTVVEHSNKNVGNVNYAGLWVIGVKDMIMQFNEVYGGRYGYNDGEAFDIDMFSHGTLYQYNYSHNNSGGFMLFMHSSTNSLVRYNISVNDGFGSGQDIFHYLPENPDAAPLIHNNTIYVGEGITTRIVSPRTKQFLKMYNNIFTGPGTLNMGSPTFSGGEMKNNVISVGATDIQETGYPGLTFGSNLYIDPQLVNPGGEPSNIITGLKQLDAEALAGYKLKENSPLIDAGLDMTGLTPLAWGSDSIAKADFFHNPLIGAPDIGAFEYPKFDVNDGQFDVKLYERLAGKLSAGDPTGKAITFSITKQPSKGSLQIVDASTGEFVYYPKGGVGQDKFEFAVTNGEETLTGTITIQIYLNTAEKDVYVRPYHLTFDDHLEDEYDPDAAYTMHGEAKYAAGQKEKALSISNSAALPVSPRLDLGEVQYGTETDFTIAFWFNADRAQNGVNSIFMGNSNYQNWWRVGWLFVAHNRFTGQSGGSGPVELAFNYQTEGTSDAVTNRVMEPFLGAMDGQWHHIAVSVTRGEKIDTFMDGKKLNTLNLSAVNQAFGTVDAGLPTVIGSDGRASQENNTNFKMDELFILPVAMTEAEINALIQTGDWELPEEPEGINGDVNGDHVIDLIDLSIVAKSLGITQFDEAWDNVKKADVNNNGVIDIEDYDLIVEHIFN